MEIEKRYKELTIVDLLENDQIVYPENSQILTFACLGQNSQQETKEYRKNKRKNNKHPTR